MSGRGGLVVTILSELVALYDRRAERESWPRPGFSSEKIGAEVVLRSDGSVVAIRSLWRRMRRARCSPA